MVNPWLQIPASDYEAHMGSPDVAQQPFLARTFKWSLEKYDCGTVALLGCATGNGLEYINRETTRRITAVDINPEYLEILRQRHENSVQELEIMEADLEACDLDSHAYSLIFAGLIFEYLDPQKVLSRIAGWLKQKGVMVVVLQMPTSDEKKVTDTSYRSIKKLEKFMKLISPETFKSLAHDAGLEKLESETVTIRSGKSFYIGTYRKV